MVDTQEIKAWCITISAVSVIGGVLNCLIPKGGIKKAFSVLLYMTVLYAVCVPFAKGEREIISFDEYISDNEYLKQEYGNISYEPARSVAEEEIEKSIISAHEREGMTVNCRVKCSLTAESFYLEEIVIDAPLSHGEKNKSRGLLREYMTEKTVIYYTGEANGEN